MASSELNGSAVILITGVMASGKSTVAQLLAESFPRSAHIRGDAFRRFVVSGRVDPVPSMPPEALEQLRIRYRAAIAAADTYVSAGFVAVMQDVIIGPILAEVIEMVTAKNLFVVALDPDPSTVAARDAARHKAGYRDGWSPTSFVNDFRSTTPRVGLWLDTTHLDAEQTVGAIRDRLGEARILRQNPDRHLSKPLDHD